MVLATEGLAELRRAIDELASAGERAATAWTTPGAPGKWSPSQVVEHVARTLDASANIVAGVPSDFPTLPRFIRALVRRFFFNRVLRTEKFPKSRSTAAFNPASGPPTPSEGRVRLFGALTRFDEASRNKGDEKVDSPIFGAITAGDFARFQAVHARHHRNQIPQV